MDPQRDTKGRSTLDRSRTVRDENLPGPRGSVIVAPEPVYGAWDVYADDDIRQLSARGLHGPGPGTGLDSDIDGAQADRELAASRAQGGQALRSDDTHAVGNQHARPARLTKTQIRARRLTQKALALRAEGWDLRDIAAEIGVTLTTIQGWFVTHRREVSLDDITDTLDKIAVPLAAENLIHGLLAGDKDYTLETLKGRGQFRRHAEQEKAAPTALPALRIEFVTAVNAGQVGSPIATGRIMGEVSIPKQITGVVVDSRPLTDDVDDTHGTGAVQVPRA